MRFGTWLGAGGSSGLTAMAGVTDSVASGVPIGMTKVVSPEPFPSGWVGASDSAKTLPNELGAGISPGGDLIRLSRLRARSA